MASTTAVPPIEHPPLIKHPDIVMSVGDASEIARFPTASLIVDGKELITVSGPGTWSCWTKAEPNPPPGLIDVAGVNVRMEDWGSLYSFTYLNSCVTSMTPS